MNLHSEGAHFAHSGRLSYPETTCKGLVRRQCCNCSRPSSALFFGRVKSRRNLNGWLTSTVKEPQFNFPLYKSSLGNRSREGQDVGTAAEVIAPVSSNGNAAVSDYESIENFQAVTSDIVGYNSASESQPYPPEEGNGDVPLSSPLSTHAQQAASVGRAVYEVCSADYSCTPVGCLPAQKPFLYYRHLRRCRCPICPPTYKVWTHMIVNWPSGCSKPLRCLRASTGCLQRATVHELIAFWYRSCGLIQEAKLGRFM